MNMRHAAIGAAIALGLCGGVAFAQPAPDKPPAQEPAKAEAQADVLVLHATNSKRGIDRRIRELPYKLPQLEQPPLSSYDSYDLLDNKQLGLGKDLVRELELPGKRTLKVRLEEIVQPKKPKAKPRYVLQASISEAGGKDVIPQVKVSAEQEEVFFMAGPAHKGGILVIGIRVLPAK
jgi:hypothetical protein